MIDNLREYWLRLPGADSAGWGAAHQACCAATPLTSAASALHTCEACGGDSCAEFLQAECRQVASAGAEREHTQGSPNEHVEPGSSAGARWKGFRRVTAQMLLGVLLDLPPRLLSRF